MSVTDAQLLEAYSRTGSVHKTGAEAGLSSSQAHRRLRVLGVVKPRGFSDAEKDTLRAEYETHAHAGTLDELAKRMGWRKTAICRVASSLGLTNPARAKPYAFAHFKDARWTSPGSPPHPRGALGMKHSEEARKVISAKSKRAWATWKTFGIGLMTEENLQRMSDSATARMARSPASNNYSRTKSGRRPDLGDIFFRSSWEANYARYLNLLSRMKIVDVWHYEPETFWFEAIRRGTRSYKPDFRVWYKNEKAPVYVEIKGWMDPKSKTKIARFKKYFPQHRLEVVGAKEYAGISQKWKSAIPLWEGK